MASLIEVRLIPAIDAVLAEAVKATERWNGFNSTHEALGVLVEEMRELEDAIRANSIEAVATEATQVSAVALRLLELCRRALTGGDDGFKSRSGA
jgi:NTP pyrophosphatase (non-canonical NTP hydrolase)